MLLFQGLSFNSEAQVTVDKIIANVGNNAVLLSELEIRFKEEKLYLNPDAEKAKCDLLYRMIQEKLMLVQANRDSIVVSADEVESQLNQRIGFFAGQLGGEDKLEEYFNKSLVEIKNDLRDNLKEQLLVQRMRGQLLGDIKVTPSDVKRFYKNIPKDSLPFYNTEVEVGQIVRFPKVSKREKERAKKRLLAIKRDILAGKTTFEDEAILNSDDLGSQVNGGDLGWVGRNDFVPEFSAVAFRLKKDSMSGAVETQFGLHLIKMIERRGDNIHCKHILIKPRITSAEKKKAAAFLDSVKDKIENDTLTFQEASFLFSDDEDTKNNGGMLYEQSTGSTKIPVENLEKDVFYLIDKLDVEEISKPAKFNTRDAREAFRIVYLKSRVSPHMANLSQDYPRLSNMAKAQKTAKTLSDWTTKKIPTVYLRVDKEYTKCGQIKGLLETIEKYN